MCTPGSLGATVSLRPLAQFPRDNSHILYTKKVVGKWRHKPTDLRGGVGPESHCQGAEGIDQTGLVDDLQGGGPVGGIEDAQVGQHRHAGLEIVVNLIARGLGLVELFGSVIKADSCCPSQPVRDPQDGSGVVYHGQFPQPASIIAFI
jgi:hypothetical protein